MKIITFQQYNFIIGQTKHENWNILELSQKHHIFFHLTSFPSCYVILQYDTENTENITDELLEKGAHICKNHTKYRNLKNIKIDYCRCDNLEKTENVGEVFFKSNRKVKQIILK